mmetsp:Transcript_58646/g.137808  ORF Transcript_58646/g.137808 Transcript_58646/m.137808 type:complete len:98 (+) Transcript_58646:2345-2638(+)
MQRAAMRNELVLDVCPEVADHTWGWTPVAEVACPFCGLALFPGMIFQLNEAPFDEEPCQPAVLCRECEGKGYVRAPIRSVVPASVIGGLAAGGGTAE